MDTGRHGKKWRRLKKMVEPFSLIAFVFLASSLGFGSIILTQEMHKKLKK
jgi:hypothetical protein